MDKTVFDNIVKKIDTLKDKQSKASGAIEAIEQEWKANEWGATREDVDKLADNTRAEIADTDEMIDKLYGELVGLTNWGWV